MSKINVSINDELLKRIDDYAAVNYLSRSGMVTLACTQFLNQNDIIQAVMRLDLAIQKIASTGQVDDETQQELDDFSRLSKLLIGVGK